MLSYPLIACIVVREQLVKIFKQYGEHDEKIKEALDTAIRHLDNAIVELNEPNEPNGE